ncbi:PTS sugar transporter subunit IIA [Candidatus Enterococcus murrayae]|uniref:PTS sugar transporter subunit IIA n=1 Tax=Candidatus Enterococcus murrayae TaxID=2815321 RepID=A0ABS3HF01_9ENTE|nr:PTS sugar transporter subunit IIA [Enterococcus sp. MJM16]MBO0451500.1 PTS sugar transporter subunit IIA [Enterococcus sp. MJM16]
MKVLEVLNTNRVNLALKTATKEETIQEMAKMLSAEGLLKDEAVFVSSVLSREEHSTTGVGNGIAIPHGKSLTVVEPAIAFARLESEVEWQALDEKPVSLVVMLAIPDSQQGETHLSILSEIAIKLMDDDVVEKLKTATKADEIVEILS